MIGLATGRADAMSLTLKRVQKLTTNETFDIMDNVRLSRPQGGIPQSKDTSHWQHGCDKTPAEADHGHELKFPILSNVTFDKFFPSIAEPHIRCHFGLLGLFAV